MTQLARVYRVSQYQPHQLIHVVAYSRFFARPNYRLFLLYRLWKRKLNAQSWSIKVGVVCTQDDRKKIKRTRSNFCLKHEKFARTKQTRYTVYSTTILRASHLTLIKLGTTCESNTLWRQNWQPSTSLAESQKALEAHGCKPWVTNSSIVPHTLQCLWNSSTTRTPFLSERE